MDELVNVLQQINATLRKQNHILLATHNLNSYEELQDVRKKEDKQ